MHGRYREKATECDGFLGPHAPLFLLFGITPYLIPTLSTNGELSLATQAYCLGSEMIFPELGPQYYNESHRDILSRMESFYAEAITINQSYWSEADTDNRFEVGDQTIWNDVYGNLPAGQRSGFYFNRIRPIVNMVWGYQSRNRKSTIVTPVENATEETADEFTKIMMWINNTENMLQTISDAFHGALVTGLNMLHVWMDYRQDPLSGNIRVDNCSYNEFIIDPYFKKPDLSDCNSIWKRSFITKRECVSLLPDQAEEIASLYGNDSGTGRDGKFQFTPQSYGYAYKNLLTYDEFYYRDYRAQKMIVDIKTGDTMEWKSEDEEMLKLFLSEHEDTIVIEQTIPTVRLAIVVQGKVMMDGPQPTGLDCYPFVPVMGYFNPQIPYWPWRISGIVRGLRDAQYLYNRRKIIELDIMESQINSGWKYKENALVDPDHVFKLSGQGRGLALKQTAQMTDVEQIMPVPVPQSMIELSKILSEELTKISGVNEELLGSAVDDKAGILSMLRQGAGITGLQNLFDQLDTSQKILGNIFLQLVQTNFMPAKVEKILGHKASDPFYNKNFGRYDSVVEEGLNTTTQRQMQFAQLLQLREVGVPVPDDVLLDACTVQKKKELTDRIMQTQQQTQQMAQQAQELEMREAQSRIDLANARSVADKGLGLERASRVQENQALAVERRAQAEKDHEMSILTAVRALKEVEQVDVSQLHKLIELSNAVRAIENVSAQQAATATI